MAEFQAALREALGDSPPDTAAKSMTPEEQEESLFRFAEVVLRLACPDPRACSHPHCRRDVRCRHFARLEAKRAGGRGRQIRRLGVHVVGTMKGRRYPNLARASMSPRELARCAPLAYSVSLRETHCARAS